ncbi:hypothetical protein, partial [Tateyamaria pelophila]|uniref:hypothetical protein n=1 Tax=Tateyamaria pelophila TaxID=328415 RepID=UPI001CBD8B57
MTQTGLTIANAATRMRAALATIRRGATPEAREAAIDDLDRAIQDAARLTSATWMDAKAKAEMVQIALMGRNA